LSASVLSRLLLVEVLRYIQFHQARALLRKFLLSSSFNIGDLYPILRANPFPEVTDLICRIPLSTLFYRPEAANLGDLMRLWVRPGVIEYLTRIFKDRNEHH
jgi:hypothetical protein